MKITKKMLFIFLLFPLLSIPSLSFAVDSYDELFSINCADVSACVDKVVDYVLTIATPIAIVFIFLSGFLFVTAQGNEQKLRAARQTLMWTLIGLAVVIGAKTFSVAFQDFFQNL